MTTGTLTTHMPPDQITVRDTFHVRRDIADVDELAESISLQPPAHPMPGYLAVMPIPAGGETGARVQLGVFSIPTAITAALVIEAGEMIDSRFETIDVSSRARRCSTRTAAGKASNDRPGEVLQAQVRQPRPRARVPGPPVPHHLPPRLPVLLRLVAHHHPHARRRLPRPSPRS